MKVIWLTGLSGSGKTTLATHISRELKKKYPVQVFDGDIIRKGLNKDLAFSEHDRLENIRRIAEVSKLFLEAGFLTINCFISPTHEIRQLAREIIGDEQFIEVYLNSSLETCEHRDVKGLYKKARNGEINNFTGISSIYETPLHPDIIIDTNHQTVDESVITLMSELGKYF